LDVTELSQECVLVVVATAGYDLPLLVEVADLAEGHQALFFDVMAEKSDQPCSTFLLRQCGQTIFPSSCSAMVKLFENVFLQA